MSLNAKRTPVIKIIAMPKDANADGDIFGGWILSMMDMAGGIAARKRAGRRVVTVALEHIVLHKPVYIGDCVECYAEIVKIGNTSITIKIETFVERKLTGIEEKVTEGNFVFVALGEDRKPTQIPKE